MITAILSRTFNGNMTRVHLSSCYMARRGKAVPWVWADNQPKAKIAQTIRHFDYRVCRRCLPNGVR